MKIYAVTQRGLNKLENEDRVIAGGSIIAGGEFSMEMDKGILAVADGVGGNRAGAVASQFVAGMLCSLRDISMEAFLDINDRLLRLAEETSDYRGMATTLSGVFLDGDMSCLFSIGNTRVYLLQGRKYLKQLTSDDTTLNYLLSTGQLSPEDADKFDRKNEINACFGGGAPELFRLSLDYIEAPKAPLLITSDGVHDYVSVDQMEAIISEWGVSMAACNALINAARDGGSHDDISIVMGEVPPPAPDQH